MFFLHDCFADIGFILTLAAFIVVLVQIFKIKRTTELIRSEVTATQSKIQKVLAISDLSKSRETINTIYSYLQNGNYELAHSKIIEINELIIEIKEVPALKNLETLRRLEDYGKYLALDLRKIQELLIVEHSKVDPNTMKTILGNLQEISCLFSKINAQLKHKNDE